MPKTTAVQKKDAPAATPEQTSQGTQSRQMVDSDRETHIKVETSRIDSVLTLTSEVGLAKNRVSSAKSRILAKDFGDDSLSSLERAVNDLERLTSALQNSVMLMRMQPIGRLFQRYPKVVRDLSRALGKQIEVRIDGHETEIDKGMIEDLADPLVHLIRNSADHGIESMQDRISSGKTPSGTIGISASQEGDRILIVIEDDGKGMDPAHIKAKAKEKGVADPAAIDSMTDVQALDLIFAPGFSTLDSATEISGRGVGMDVVKTNISKMGGEITINSKQGFGTRMEIRIPLTLAVLPALLLRCSGQTLALPLAAVQEILSMGEQSVHMAGNKPVLTLRGEVIRILDLSDLLGWGPLDNPPVAALVDMGSGRKAALLADGFIGREEVMIKALDGAKAKGVSGVMVDANGDIVLILDLKEILSPYFSKSSD